MTFNSLTALSWSTLCDRAPWRQPTATHAHAKGPRGSEDPDSVQDLSVYL